MRALAMGVAVLCVAPTAAAAESWIELKTDGFTLVSNAGEGTARRTANEFEQARAAYGRLWPWMEKARALPTLVVALDDEGSLRRWAPGSFEKSDVSWVSVWVEGPDRLYLLLRTDRRPADQDVTPNYNLYRAYLRMVLRNGVGRPFPPWLEAGLASVLANITVRDREVLLGRPVPWELRHFRSHARLRLQQVFDARWDAPMMNDEIRRAQFDAHCHVLVHYLLFGDREARSAKLDAFQRAWLSGASHDRAAREAFGDLEALEGELPSYATRKILSYARYEVEARIAAAKPPIRPLPAAELAALQAAVHVAMGRPVEAQTAIRQSREGDPRSAASYDAEGLLADRDRDEARAREAFGQAVALGSTRAYSHYRSAQLLWRPRSDEAILAALRQRLERAVELEPDYAAARSFLAEVLADQGQGDLALQHAERAVTLEPGRSYHRLSLARALHRLGRADEALQVAELGLRLAENPAERTNAESLLRFLDESARYDAERTRAELADACWSGDRDACVQAVPDVDRRCASGQAPACVQLAWLYQQGPGVDPDPARALDYRGRACAAGDKDSCLERAWMLLQGDAVPKDVQKGSAELDTLCVEGYLRACTRLAVSLLGGASRADQRKARDLLARSCAGGERDACALAEKVR